MVKWPFASFIRVQGIAWLFNLRWNVIKYLSCNIIFHSGHLFQTCRNNWSTLVRRARMESTRNFSLSLAKWSEESKIIFRLPVWCLKLWYQRVLTERCQVHLQVEKRNFQLNTESWKKLNAKPNSVSLKTQNQMRPENHLQ